MQVEKGRIHGRIDPGLLGRSLNHARQDAIAPNALFAKGGGNEAVECLKSCQTPQKEQALSLGSPGRHRATHHIAQTQLNRVQTHVKYVIGSGSNSRKYGRS